MADSRAKAGWADGTGAVPDPTLNWSYEIYDSEDSDDDSEDEYNDDQDEDE